MLSQALAVGGLAPQAGGQIKAFPKQMCWLHGVTGQEGKPSVALSKGDGGHPPCLSVKEGDAGVNIPSTEDNSQKLWLMPDFYFVYEAKKNQTPCAAD